MEVAGFGEKDPAITVVSYNRGHSLILLIVVQTFSPDDVIGYSLFGSA